MSRRLLPLGKRIKSPSETGLVGIKAETGSRPRVKNNKGEIKAARAKVDLIIGLLHEQGSIFKI
jgi:hypothetical protein